MFVIGGGRILEVVLDVCLKWGWGERVFAQCRTSQVFFKYVHCGEGLW